VKGWLKVSQNQKMLKWKVFIGVIVWHIPKKLIILQAVWSKYN